MDRDGVLQRLKGGVVLGEHKKPNNLVKKYKHTFVAKKAVEFLVTSRTVSDTSEAIRVCRSFEKEGLIGRIHGNGTFEKDGSLYRFRTKFNRKEEADKIMEKIQPKVIVADRKYLLSTYRGCFLGSDFVSIVVNVLFVDRNKATQIGQALLSVGYIQHVTGSGEFEDDKGLFRFYKVRQNPRFVLTLYLTELLCLLMCNHIPHLSL